MNVWSWAKSAVLCHICLEAGQNLTPNLLQTSLSLIHQIYSDIFSSIFKCFQRCMWTKYAGWQHTRQRFPNRKKSSKSNLPNLLRWVKGIFWKHGLTQSRFTRKLLQLDLIRLKHCKDNWWELETALKNSRYVSWFSR